MFKWIYLCEVLSKLSTAFHHSLKCPRFGRQSETSNLCLSAYNLSEVIDCGERSFLFRSRSKKTSRYLSVRFWFTNEIRSSGSLSPFFPMLSNLRFSFMLLLFQAFPISFLCRKWHRQTGFINPLRVIVRKDRHLRFSLAFLFLLLLFPPPLSRVKTVVP